MTSTQTSIVKQPSLRKQCCGMWMAIATAQPLVLRCLACGREQTTQKTETDTP